MARKMHTAEEIVAKLRQIKVLMAQGRLVADAVRAIAAFIRKNSGRRILTRSSGTQRFW
ncbi:MAG: hypothetical protein KGZ73_15555 [Rhizobiales bacterium]|nr:hypothetical protein [Hyphomicrobiales bacterium]